MPFLTAAWNSLVFLNYEFDPAVLAKFVPPGVELDDFEGRTLASIVGFRFTKTKLGGIPVPFHTHFSEVNLRFYVRRIVAGEVRRGVVFIQEIVPLPAIALVARAAYGERYVCRPMRFRTGERGANFDWRSEHRWNSVSIVTDGTYAAAASGSEEEYITEHFYGYVRRRDGVTLEYNVRHPSWNVAHALESSFDCDVASVYGPEFVEALCARPVSAFFADGSDVSVFGGKALPKP